MKNKTVKIYFRLASVFSYIGLSTLLFNGVINGFTNHESGTEASLLDSSAYVFLSLGVVCLLTPILKAVKELTVIYFKQKK